MRPLLFDLLGVVSAAVTTAAAKAAATASSTGAAITAATGPASTTAAEATGSAAASAACATAEAATAAGAAHRCGQFALLDDSKSALIELEDAIALEHVYAGAIDGDRSATAHRPELASATAKASASLRTSLGRATLPWRGLLRVCARKE